MTQTPTMTMCADEWAHEAKKETALAALAKKVRSNTSDIVRMDVADDSATDERRELWAAIAELRAEIAGLKQEAAVAAR